MENKKIKIKGHQVEIDQNNANPYTKDQLDRKPHVQLLCNLVENSPDSFVLSLNAPWGSGKTTFLKMLESELVKRKNYCIYFNAWENDFTDFPLVSFISEIQKFISDSTLEGKDALHGYLNNAKKLGGAFLIKAIPALTKLGTAGLIDCEEIAGMFEKIAEEEVKKYQEQKKSLVGFRNNLEKFSVELIKKTGEESNKKLVVLVDELDRCRPTYAIELLENIKHFFAVKGIVFRH